MKYFVTLTVECGPDGAFDASNDAEAIKIVRQQYVELAARKETIRELCIHKVTPDSIMPIFSRNFAYGSTIPIAGEDGQTREYNLGLPITIRQILGQKTEVTESTAWPLESEETEKSSEKEFSAARKAIRRAMYEHFKFPR